MMAEAKQCDRCGKYYTSYGGKKNEGELMKVSQIATGNEGFLNKSKDLCAECMISFIGWFNAGKAERED